MSSCYSGFDRSRQGGFRWNSIGLRNDLATRAPAKRFLEAVRTSINPKVIDAAESQHGRSTIDASRKTESA